MLSQKSIQTVSSLVSLLILYKIREYLGEVPKCACYKGKDGTTKHDSIDRLQFITAIIMGIIVIFAISNLFNEKPSKLMALLFPIIVIVYLLYVYNVHDFRHNVASKCSECTDKWPKYAMYAYALVYVIMLALVLMSGIFIATSMSSMTDPRFRMISVSMVFLIGLVAYTVMGGSINDIVDFLMEHNLLKASEGFSCGCSSGKCNKETPI